MSSFLTKELVVVEDFVGIFTLEFVVGDIRKSFFVLWVFTLCQVDWSLCYAAGAMWWLAGWCLVK